jgi:hypothetical protein
MNPPREMFLLRERETSWDFNIGKKDKTYYRKSTRVE